MEKVLIVYIDYPDKHFVPTKSIQCLWSHVNIFLTRIQIFVDVKLWQIFAGKKLVKHFKCFQALQVFQYNSMKRLKLHVGNKNWYILITFGGLCPGCTVFTGCIHQWIPICPFHLYGILGGFWCFLFYTLMSEVYE